VTKTKAVLQRILLRLPSLLIDSPAVPGVFGPPEDDDILVVVRGSKRRRTGRKFSLLSGDTSRTISNQIRCLV
jgi:hypothetical protein